MKRNTLRKRTITLFTAAVMALSLSGCGKSNGESKKLSGIDGGQDTQESTENNSEVTTENVTETTSEVNNDLDYEVVYAPVFDDTLDLIMNGYDYERELDYYSSGLIENVIYRDKVDLLNSIGYVITDINGDDVPELLIGEDMIVNYDTNEKESYIYNAYTYKNGEIVCFLEGWARNSFRWMGNGNFFYFGSASAVSSMFGKCHLSADGTKLEWDDFYYSDETGNGEIGYYHNTTGMVDASASEKLNVPDNEFWDIADTFKCELINWTLIGKDVEISDEDRVMGDITGNWLFPSGASVFISKDGDWSLSDDENNWVFGGNWEFDDQFGDYHIRFFSEVGDAGNYQVASATLYYDPSGYPQMDIEFEKGLTDFTNGTITMSKGL